MPHGPALWVLQLGTLRGHRPLFSDLRLANDSTVYAAIDESAQLLYITAARRSGTPRPES